MQKPYACTLPGCTKRYTDPSSLRKHVKNHSSRDYTLNGRRKSHKETTTTHTTTSRRRHSESSVLTTYEEPQTPVYHPCHENQFNYDEVFINQSKSVEDVSNQVNINELSNSLIKMFQNEEEKPMNTDEYISYEYVKNFLTDSNIIDDYLTEQENMDQTCMKAEQPFEYDFFGVV